MAVDLLYRNSIFGPLLHTAHIICYASLLCWFSLTYHRVIVGDEPFTQLSTMRRIFVEASLDNKSDTPHRSEFCLYYCLDTCKLDFVWFVSRCHSEVFRFVFLPTFIILNKLWTFLIESSVSSATWCQDSSVLLRTISD